MVTNDLSFCAPLSFAMQMIGIYIQSSVVSELIGYMVSTFVFLINASNAPTPPLSPADIPSTSSIIRQVLSVIGMPATFVAYKASRTVFAGE